MGQRGSYVYKLGPRFAKSAPIWANGAPISTKWGPNLPNRRPDGPTGTVFLQIGVQIRQNGSQMGQRGALFLHIGPQIGQIGAQMGQRGADFYKLGPKLVKHEPIWANGAYF
jgi:hypothetical protein